MPKNQNPTKGKIKAGLGSLIGNAGEYYVLAELLKRDVIAAIAPRNAPSFDILATKADKTIKIRVKTKSEQYPVWQWSIKKDGSIFRDLNKNEDFTILVDLAKETKDLKFYIVPTRVIDQLLKEDFNIWINAPGKNNRPHSRENKKRHLDQDKYANQLQEYLDNWEILWNE